ncbi:tetratricopeptide repeat protein [Desulfobacterales bacterium HSG2]|nr:tetratricopeptide repeat protein [Desulfobacterales bacterium HSG2]
MKVETRNSKLETRNSKLETRNLKLGTRNSISSTDNGQRTTDNGQRTTRTTDNRQHLYQKAFTLAGLGRLDEAERWCKQAINTEKLHPGYHYLLATIYLEQGRMPASARSFRHALFLDPDFVLAHFSLGNLKQREGKHDESAKHLRNALSLLLSLDTEDILPYSEGLTAGRLLEVVRSMLVP